MSHPLEHQLQQFIDKSLDEDQERIISVHLLSCVYCTRRVRKLERMESLIRQSFTERAPERLRENVLKQLDINEAPSFAWKFLRNLAPLFGLIIIGIIVFAVFKYTGKLNEPGIQSSLQTGQSVYTKMNENLASSVGVFNTWMRTYVPFAFAGKSGGLTAFISLFFIAIAFLDRFVFAPMLRRGKRA
jgi:Fe2+ transport system protein B